MSFQLRQREEREEGEDSRPRLRGNCAPELPHANCRVHARCGSVCQHPPHVWRGAMCRDVVDVDNETAKAGLAWASAPRGSLFSGPGRLPQGGRMWFPAEQPQFGEKCGYLSLAGRGCPDPQGLFSPVWWFHSSIGSLSELLLWGLMDRELHSKALKAGESGMERGGPRR